MTFFRKPNIEKLKAKNNVKGLIKALRHRSSRVREGAADRLGEIGEPAKEAVPALMKALGHE